MTGGSMELSHGKIIDRAHHFKVRVYYSDTDAGGVVYHSRYLDFAEHARTEMIDLLGDEEKQRHHMHETGAGFVVSSINIQYKKPARLDDELTVQTRMKKCERFSMLMEQDIYRNDELLSSMDIRIAYIGLSDGRPRPLPSPWKEKLQALIQS